MASLDLTLIIPASTNTILAVGKNQCSTNTMNFFM